MKIKFLGTSAAHSLPLPFCNCNYCKKTRELGGKNYRKRSSILINDDLIIDIGPDFMTASFMHNVDTSKVRYWLQTHSHSDHFSAEHIITRMPEYAVENIEPLFLYASQKCIHNISKKLNVEEFGANLFEKDWLKKLSLNVNSVKHFEKIIFDSYSITAFDANHDNNDGSSIYLVADNSCKLFYALDTNGLTEETINYLYKEKVCLDIIVLDHTYGYNVNANDHLNANKFIETINTMKNKKIINQNTKVYASHISHEGNLLHDEFVNFAKEHRYNVAYDGLEIEIVLKDNRT